MKVKYQCANPMIAGWLMLAAFCGCATNRDAVQASLCDESTAEYTNSLGMRFVPVPGTDVLFGIWAVRVKDCRAYAQANKNDDVDESWRRPGFRQGGTDPVVNVSWDDAKAFCAWLSRNEGERYRLPTDAEWSMAVGLTNEIGNTPSEKGLVSRIYG